MKSRSIVAAAIAPYQNGILPRRRRDGAPEKGQRKQCRAAPRGRTDKTPMSRGRKKSRDDEGSMSRTQKKDRGSANNVTQPQKAAKKPQCLAAAKKPPRRRIDVARPKKGQGNTKQCRAAPKGRSDESPMSRTAKKRRDDKGSMSRAPKKDRGKTKQCRTAPKGRADKTPTSRPQKKTTTTKLECRGIAVPFFRCSHKPKKNYHFWKPCCNKPKSYFKYFSQIVIRFITQSGKKTAFPGSTKLLN